MTIDDTGGAILKFATVGPQNLPVAPFWEQPLLAMLHFDVCKSVHLTSTTRRIIPSIGPTLMSNKPGLVFAIVVGAALLMISYSILDQNQREPALPESSAQALKSQLDQPGLVLAKFGAPWCPPCRAVDKELEKLASLMAGDVEVLTINVDHEPSLSQQFNVRSIPRILLFQDGNKIKDHTGFVTFDVMQGWVRQAAADSSESEVQLNPLAES